MPEENDLQYQGKIRAKVTRGIPGRSEELRVLSSVGADAVMQLVLWVEANASSIDEFTRRDLLTAIAAIRKEIA